ncbi:class I glutamine amidotransferase-like protein, partial [Clavulina sp. PMI_390]
RAVFCLPDYGFDPSEAAVPFTFLMEKGVECTIATQTGKSPVCDRRMIEGWTGSLLGAKAAARVAYAQFAASDTFKTPLAWTSPEFSLLDYDAVILPGGHDKGVKQIIEDEVLRTKLRDFFPLTEGEEPSKVCGAICHGVLILAWTKDASGEHSVLYNRRTTTLPIHLERLAVYGTGLVLGDYYRTYAGTWTAKEVVQALKTPEQYSPGPFNFS